MAEKTMTGKKTKSVVRRPPLHKVVLLNDDYTTMDFVVSVLVQIFHKSAAEATQIMLDVHQKGKGIVGLYPLDIARTKVAQVEQMAGQAGYPLMASVEA